MIGYGGKTVNTLRLWSATAAHAFDFQRFSGGDFVASIAEALNAESLTRVLYPDDHTPQGPRLSISEAGMRTTDPASCLRPVSAPCDT